MTNDGTSTLNMPDQHAQVCRPSIPQSAQKSGQSPFQQSISYSELPLNPSHKQKRDWARKFGTLLSAPTGFEDHMESPAFDSRCTLC